MFPSPFNKLFGSTQGLDVPSTGKNKGDMTVGVDIIKLRIESEVVL